MPNKVLAHDIQYRVAKIVDPQAYYDDFEYYLAVQNIAEAKKVAEELLAHISSEITTDSPDSVTDKVRADVVNAMALLRSALPAQYDISTVTYNFPPKFTVTIKKITDQYAAVDEYVGKEIEGTWVHMLKKNVGNESDDLLYTKVVTTISVNGEICASDFVQGNWFGYSEDSVGIVFQGVATHVFNKDVYSSINMFGERELTTTYHGQNRLEAWINPQLCTPLALVVHTNAPEELIEEVREIADIFGLEFFIDKQKAGWSRYLVEVAAEEPIYSTIKNTVLMTAPTHFVESNGLFSAYLMAEELSSLDPMIKEFITTETDYVIWDNLRVNLQEAFPPEFSKYAFMPDGYNTMPMDLANSIYANADMLDRWQNPLTFLLSQASQVSRMYFVIDPLAMDTFVDKVMAFLNGVEAREAFDDQVLFTRDIQYNFSHFYEDFFEACVK